MQSKFALFLLVGGLLVLSACSTERKQTEELATSDELAGKVGDWTITREEISEHIRQLTPPQQERFNTIAGRAELTDDAIEQEFYHQEGLNLGYGEDPEIVEQAERYLRNLIIAKYYREEIKKLARPTDEELYEYYQLRQDKFTRPKIARAQHIYSKNRDKLVDFKRRIEAGEPMTTLAHKYSEDAMTRDDGGNLGYFNPGGYIRGLGYNDVVSDAAFSMEVGVVSDPIKINDGWSLLRVNELRPETVRPFDEVKEEIVEELSKSRIEEVKTIAFNQLKEKYDYTNYYENELNLKTRTAEELWSLAQNSTDPYHRVRNYQEIVDRFPEHPYASQALFMVGFVQSEELKMYEEAGETFGRVLMEYPDSDVAESAKYMLEALKNPGTDFEPKKKGVRR